MKLKLLILMQRYGDFGLIPRNLPDSCRSCCDRGSDLRQSGGRGVRGCGKAERSTALEMTKGISPCAALSRDDKQKRGVQSFESTKENGENYFFYDFSGERCCS